MQTDQNVEIAIVGAGIAGIATAYYLCKKYQQRSVVLIDHRDPMSYTSAQSGDNYRNWWPSKVMTDFSDHSISLMQSLAQESNNALQMQQKGYALATRESDITDLISTLESNFSGHQTPTDALVRVHTQSAATSYLEPYNSDPMSSIAGVDVLSHPEIIKATFPAFSDEIKHVLHVRRAGHISGQQMGQYMLQQVKPLGCSRIRAQLVDVSRDNNYQISLKGQDGEQTIHAKVLINAAGPFISDIASMLDIELPVESVFHQKIAFEDHLDAVPREQPFAIDLDQANLNWSVEERESLLAEPHLKWLTEPIDGGVHCRPEGLGKWIKLGWAYNRSISNPEQSRELVEDPHYDELFPEIVLRGAARLNPNLKPYIDDLPRNRTHYGGYYTMTKENWPLIGPLDNRGAFIVGALSGFGSMAACASGELCADWVCGGALPDYANALSPNRYNDEELMQELSGNTNIGLL